MTESQNAFVLREMPVKSLILNAPISEEGSGEN